MTGELEKSPQRGKNLFNIVETICYRAAKYFCSLWATQNLSSSLMLRLICLLLVSFCREEKKNHAAAVAFAPFLLIFTQIRAHGRRDLLAIFWVFMKTLPHFQSRKNRALICVSWRVCSRIRIITISPEMKTKGTTTSNKKCHQHIMLYICMHATTGGWGGGSCCRM